MQKIMFEHKRFRLEQAVIARTKTMTRRRVLFPKCINDKDVKRAEMGIDRKGRVYFSFTASTDQGPEYFDIYPKYQIGERVAVAQDYGRIFTEDDLSKRKGSLADLINGAGWSNKMFVSPGIMPHIIQITDIKAERLSEISYDDCMAEGIMKGEFMNTWDTFYFDEWGDVPNHQTFKTPHAAFASLIDRLSGRGTWERNEWQFTYKFKLIK